MTGGRYKSTVRIEGHIVDSDILSKVFDLIIGSDGRFEIKEFTIGRTNVDHSQATLEISAPSRQKLEVILNLLSPRGCFVVTENNTILRRAPKAKTVPDDFYSTTNYKTEIRHNNKWINVRHQRMDGVIVVSGQRAEVRKLRDIRKGDQIVCGLDGIRVHPEFKARDREAFGFMANEISSEKKVAIAVDRVADIIRQRQGKCLVVAGPVVIHTGVARSLSRMIKGGFVDGLLAGNALAVHDIENALFGTSLGIDTSAGTPVDQGHRNHMRAINQINLAGGIKQAVARKVLRSGIMYECIKGKIPFVLAGSLRDDGPLPETVTDMNEAQNAYTRLLQNAEVVLMLGTMLHSIATGNMLPAWVKTICVDINAAVVTKLADRGSAQTIGIVTDVGLFLHLLANRLCS
ncbi:MAG: TIGR00300 family protein [candidate division Zixibacteria bacterium]|nr:TIGR00300 family protein [candidate division Zixibacteria bacterium]